MRRYFTASTIACALCGAWWLLALIVPARAAETEWWILHGQNVRCVTAVSFAPGAASVFGSPALLQSYLRQHDDFKDITVKRSNDGQILAVAVKDQGSMTMMYFPSKELCEATRLHLLANGILTDPKELK